MTVAQEDRLVILTADGRALLFILGPGAGPGLEEIEAWSRDGKAVVVRYEGEPDAGAVAVAVAPVSQQQSKGVDGAS